MITPSEFSKLLTTNDARLETRIDKAIREQSASGMFRDIALTVGGWDRDCIDRVLAKYSASGWDAEYVDDPRDGDFIRIRRRA